MDENNFNGNENENENQNENENGNQNNEPVGNENDSQQNINSLNGISDKNAAAEEDKREKPKLFTDMSISGIIKSLEAYWNYLTKKQKILWVVVALSIIIAAIVIVAVLNNPGPYVTILKNLDNSDAADIMEYLEANKLDYKYEAGTIRVREKISSETLMQITRLGLPRTGDIVYEKETTSGMFGTEAQYDDIERENLQRRLEASIKSLTGVESATVTLAIEKKRTTLLVKSPSPPTASIIIRMKNGYELSYEDIKGIEKLVAYSVVDLAEENVTISDQTGRRLNDEGKSDADILNNIKMEYEYAAEQRIDQKILDIFEPIYGVGNVVVRSNVTFSFDKIIRESTSFDGANEDEETGERKGVVNSESGEHSVGVGDPESVGGPPGTNLNIDTPTYYEEDSSVGEQGYWEDIIFNREYSVNQVIEQLQRDIPEAVDASLSIAINTQDIDSDLADSIIMAAATASGIKGIAQSHATEDDIVDVDYFRNYITLVATPFVTAGEEVIPEPSQLIRFLRDLSPLQLLIISVILLLFIIIIIITVIIIRRRKKTQVAEEGEYDEFTGGAIAVDEFGRAIARHAVNEEMQGDTMPRESREAMLKKQIRFFIDQNPEVAAQLIRTMIKGEEGK